MALFHMLFKEGYKFDVAFVNYKTRPESDLEQELVQKYCDICHTFCYILEKKCSSAGNFENEARNIRYSFFHQIYLNTQKYDAILVAHNADDLIETFVMQADRGILPDAYGLMFESSYAGVKILRPLLRYEKEFLTNYCLKNNVPFSIDSSNSDTKYKRNKIRKEYISKLSFEEKNKIVHEISKKNDEIKKVIIEKLGRGVTVVPAIGGYSGDNYEMLVCTLSSSESYVLKDYIFEIDPTAFTFFVSAKEVYGDGFEIQ